MAVAGAPADKTIICAKEATHRKPARAVLADPRRATRLCQFGRVSHDAEPGSPGQKSRANVAEVAVLTVDPLLHRFGEFLAP